MKNTVSENPSTPVLADTPHRHDIEDVEMLANDLKHLLVRHERLLQEEGIRKEVAVLERWMESYRGGLVAADNISERGMDWLLNLRTHLKLAIEEMHRLEGEGGNPSSKEQLDRMDDLLRAIGRIDNVLPDLEQMFSRTPQDEKEDA